MGNCHSKSDDHRHGGRDGYSSSTEKLNPRPYNPSNPNSTINYTKNKIVVNLPPGQATVSQRRGQATVSQRQQQQQFSSPPKGKRRAEPKPEYYLRVGCSICREKCMIAPDFDIRGAKFYQDPLYRGPMKEWQLEFEFCDLVTSMHEARRQQDGPAFLKLQKEKGWSKTPQQVLERYVKDADLGPVEEKPSGPVEVKKLLDELKAGNVKFSSSL